MIKGLKHSISEASKNFLNANHSNFDRSSLATGNSRRKTATV